MANPHPTNVAFYDYARLSKIYRQTVGYKGTIASSINPPPNPSLTIEGNPSPAKAQFSGTINLEPTGTATLTVAANSYGAAGNKTITGDGVKTCAVLIGAGYTITAGGTEILKDGDEVAIAGGVNGSGNPPGNYRVGTILETEEVEKYLQTKIKGNLPVGNVNAPAITNDNTNTHPSIPLPMYTAIAEALTVPDCSVNTDTTCTFTYTYLPTKYRSAAVTAKVYIWTIGGKMLPANVTLKFGATTVSTVAMYNDSVYGFKAITLGSTAAGNFTIKINLPTAQVVSVQVDVEDADGIVFMSAADRGTVTV